MPVHALGLHARDFIVQAAPHQFKQAQRDARIWYFDTEVACARR
jgi:hypothetical protein